MEKNRVIRAVIPTTSTYLISRAVGSALDPIIYYMKASSGALVAPSVKSQPHRWVKIVRSTTKAAYMTYNRKTSREEFDLMGIAELLSEESMHDLWIHELRLRLRYGHALFDFVFKNEPLTLGSEAERWVQKYHEDLVRAGWVARTKLRHLSLLGARSVPRERGGDLTSDQLSSPDFIKWLSEQTAGLIKMKIMERVDETTYVDVAIRNAL